MSEFALHSESGVHMTFHNRHVNADGWVMSYALTVEAPGFRADLRVDNPGFGQPPSVLFQEMAAEWSGWRGKKEWSAIEGECDFSATADSTGHISFTARLHPRPFPPYWSGEVALILEAGVLEQLAVSATAFFGRQPRDG